MQVTINERHMSRGVRLPTVSNSLYQDAENSSSWRYISVKLPLLGNQATHRLGLCENGNSYCTVPYLDAEIKHRLTGNMT